LDLFPSFSHRLPLPVRWAWRAPEKKERKTHICTVKAEQEYVLAYDAAFR
jgi:hypothetical protein